MNEISQEKIAVGEKQVDDLVKVLEASVKKIFPEKVISTKIEDRGYENVAVYINSSKYNLPYFVIALTEVVEHDPTYPNLPEHDRIFPAWEVSRIVQHQGDYNNPPESEDIPIDKFRSYFDAIEAVLIGIFADDVNHIVSGVALEHFPHDEEEIF